MSARQPRPADATMSPFTIPPTLTHRDRTILSTRAELRVARAYGDLAGEAAALALLTDLGVDEAGDELVPAGRGAVTL